jgi:hypothetical protein
MELQVFWCQIHTPPFVLLRQLACACAYYYYDYCSVGKNYTLQPVNKKTIIKIKNNTALQLQHRDEVGFLLIEIKLAL